MKSAKILIADEDLNVSHLRSMLITKGYDVIWTKNQQEAIDVFSTQIFDFCIIGFSLPPKGGLTLLKSIRAMNRRIPVMVMASHTSEKDRINAFRAGCDDLVLKSYSNDEILLRIKAILKRVRTSSRRPTMQVTNYVIGHIKFDIVRQTLSVNNNIINHLTTRETSLLSLLCENKNHLLERNEALVRVWGEEGFFNARTMDVYITRLRQYLKADPNVHIINVHGIGFKLVIDQEETE